MSHAGLRYGTSFTPQYRGITRAALRVANVGSGLERKYSRLDVLAFALVDTWRKLSGNNGGHRRLPAGIRDVIESEPSARFIGTKDGDTFAPIEDPEDWLRARLSSPEPFAIISVDAVRLGARNVESAKS